MEDNCYKDSLCSIIQLNTMKLKQYWISSLKLSTNSSKDKVTTMYILYIKKTSKLLAKLKQQIGFLACFVMVVNTNIKKKNEKEINCRVNPYNALNILVQSI